MPRMSSLPQHSRSSTFWSESAEGLHRIWWGVRYGQPLALLGGRLTRKDEYLAWFDTVESPVLRHTAGQWSFCRRAPTMVGAQAFNFFGIERVLSDNRGWHWRPWGENWLRNLHAFDDLVADGAEARFEWHEKLITNWIVANAPGKGVGWQSYSLARRIVNWIKWQVDRDGLNEVGRRNLVVQTRFLRQRLGASLNVAYPAKAAKALVFAGAFFEGQEAAGWRKTGVAVLSTVLRSGYLRARLEASDRYRNALVEDLLDLIQLDKMYPGLLDKEEVQRWQDLLPPLLAVAGDDLNPPEEESDAVVFPEPSAQDLRLYAQRLGLASAG